MQIKFVSVTVEDQERALRFYTDVLGFEKAADVPIGEYRWLTVTSPDGRGRGRARPGADGVPAGSGVPEGALRRRRPGDGLRHERHPREVERLTAAGVEFRGEPVDMGSVTGVMFEDTCGNLIHLVQPTV